MGFGAIQQLNVIGKLKFHAKSRKGVDHIFHHKAGVSQFLVEKKWSRALYPTNESPSGKISLGSVVRRFGKQLQKQFELCKRLFEEYHLLCWLDQTQ
jgi:hypothetical protein